MMGLLMMEMITMTYDAAPTWGIQRARSSAVYSSPGGALPHVLAAGWAVGVSVLHR
jgi:hypothetical protein